MPTELTRRSPEQLIRVYIAGPLFGSGRSTANVFRAISAAERVRRGGLHVFVPHLYHYWDTISPHEDADYWLDMDRAWLLMCDAMVRLHGESPGSTKEEQWCEEHSIPVYHEGDGDRGIHKLITDYDEGRLRPRAVGLAQVVAKAYQDGHQDASKRLTLEVLQHEQKQWSDHCFGPQPASRMIMGLVEELGEIAEAMPENSLFGDRRLVDLIKTLGRIAHAQLKMEQGIRGSKEELRAKLEDGIGDHIIYLSGLCNTVAVSMQAALERTWSQVSKRDWKKDRLTGGESVE